MSFGDPRLLWLLLVLPSGMVAFFWWSARKRQRLMQQFIRARLLPGLVAGVSTRRQKIRATGIILAVVCLIVALARPRWGYDLQEVTQRGLDIVVAIDTSKSMLAQDINPNRLARAKLAALDLMQQAKSDRLGLVAFAGSAFLQCPLTIDDTAFRESLEALNVNTIPEGGTALAQAIETAQQAFKEGDNYRILVMFTDGEDLESGAVAAAKAAAAKGLRIFTIGVGTAEGDLLRVPDAKGQMDYVRDENGNVVKSHLNTALLEDIARATPGGFYLPLQGANTIDVLYQRGLAPLPKSETKERWLRRPQERYQWPLALAIVLLVGELLFPERKRPARPSGRGASGTADAGPMERPPARLAAAAPATTVGALLLFLTIPGLAGASPSSALREYRSGKYDEALQQYEQSIQKRSEDLRLHFNAGTAAYQDRKFDQAARYFGDALSSPDLNLQQPAYYNLGNTLFHLGEQNPDPQKRETSWEDALKQYESAIKLNTNDADARFNYKYVKERLEELKKQQQQQQQQNQNQQNPQNQQNQQSQSSQDKQQQQQSKNDQQQKQQSKSDQQQNSQPQQSRNGQSGQQQQEQPQPANSKKSDQDRQQQQASQPQEQAKQQPQSNDREQGQEQKGQESANQGSEQNQAAAGQMTPKEAKQLLDSQKDKDMMLPVSRKQEPSDQQRVVRDW
jgi:Ca-activated chloride channel family protein